MGFYLDLNPQSTARVDFREGAPPPTFWVLFLIGVFAILCMVLAAHQILGDLFKSPGLVDWILMGGLGFVVALFLGAGLKLLAFRKFIQENGDKLLMGYDVFGFPWVFYRFPRKQVARLYLYNHKPAPNLAPQFHDDPQYFIKGHWRLVIETHQGKKKVLDKHVEKDALEPLFRALSAWQENRTV